ncbi:histone-lysine N-methyltransferase NSD2-like [Styela clava]
MSEEGDQFPKCSTTHGGSDRTGGHCNGDIENENTQSQMAVRTANGRVSAVSNIGENLDISVKQECDVGDAENIENFLDNLIKNEEAIPIKPEKSDIAMGLSPADGIENVNEEALAYADSDKHATAENLAEIVCPKTNRASLRQRKRKESLPAKVEPITPVAVLVKEKLPPVERPINWFEGELVWSFVTGHPLWPCMVSIDPELGVHSKLMGCGTSSHRSYHVQFFGDSPEHAWVNDSRVFKFSNKDEYEDLVKSIAKRTQKRPPKVEISSRFHDNWHAAIDEISLAVMITSKQRLEKYTFDYVNKIPRKPLDGGSTVRKKSSTKADTPNTKKKIGNVSPSQKTITKLTPKQKSNIITSDSLTKKKTGIPKKTASPSIQKLSSNSDYSKLVIGNKKVNSSTMPHAQGEEQSPKSYVCMYCQDIYFSVADMRDHCKEKHSDGKKVIGKRQPKTGEMPNISPIECLPNNSVSEKLTSDELDVPCDVCGEKFASKRSLGQHKRFIHPSDCSVEVKAISDQTKTNMPQSIIAIPVTLNKPKSESPVPAVRLRSRSLAISQNKKGPICVLCEKNGDVVSCTSLCHRSFHVQCLGDYDVSDPFVCKDCVNKTHLCIICNQTSIDGDGLGDLKRCVVALCGRFFHSTCLQIYKLKGISDVGDKNIVSGPSARCPSHSCATCISKALVDDMRGGNQSQKLKVQNKSRMFKCIRCPTSYHVGDDCLAAGSVLLGGLSIVCPEHFKPSKTLNHHHPVHISWCFVCSKGGELICCATCPAAFHAECIELDKTPEGDWHCLDCTCGVRPLYDDIIWVKLGTYRWWPGQVTHPNDVPDNICRLQHGAGEFVVRFFGSNDYFWLSKCRVFLYQEGDNGATNRHCSRGISGVFKKALQEAEESFAQVMAARQLQEEVKIAVNDKKPAPYKHIKVNRPVGNVQIYSAPLSQMAKCVCKRNDNHPCGQDSECLNRMLMYECHPAVCTASERCENQRFQKCEYPPTEIFKTEWGGWGLKTKEFIKKGQFVNEYVGELVDEEECRRRIEQSHKDNVTNFYMLTIDKDRIIDAGPKGNYSRFMNHCCLPNCETQKWMVNGDTRVGLFALRDIMPGEELTFNYNLDCLGNDKTKCVCGSKNCSGFIGVRPKAQIDGIKRERKKKRRTRRLDSIPQHDDFCFRCRQTGTLVCCDFKGCLRAFCLECLHIEKPPYGKWECPCHHCDWCGRRAQYFCSFCPNSFCGSHVHNQLTPSIPNKFDTCNDHDPEKAEFEMAQVVAMVNDLVNAPMEEETSSEPSPADSPSNLIGNHIDELPLLQTEYQPIARKRKRKSTVGSNEKKNRTTDTE